MSLSSALGAAMSGLNVSQAGIDITSRNIANVDTPGYTRKIQQQTNALAGGEGIGVRREAAMRQIDAFLQQQLRTASAESASLNIKSSVLNRVDAMFGTPNSNASIAGSIGELATMLQELANDPESDAARQSLLNEADNLAAKFNAMSDTIQSMRLEAERNIASSVESANALLQTIADVNKEIAQRQTGNLSVADLQDQRDTAINELSRLMDVKTVDRDDGAVTVFTSGGQLLLDRTPVQLRFDERSKLDPVSLYDTDPARRGVGTISLVSGSTTIDLLAAGGIRSGAIAGYVALRDAALPQAQAQLDELAAQLALTLSEETVGSIAATAGAATGLDIDTSSMVSGNTISLGYTVGGVRQSVTIMRVDDPSALPLSNTATADPGDTVIGVNFNQPMAAIIADLQAALPADVVVSNPSGNVIRFLDDGVAGNSDIDALSATVTPAGLTGTGTGAALFVDGTGGTIFSNNPGDPLQKTGFASRIHLNRQIVADNTLLVTYETDTPLGDAARPLDLLARLTSTTRSYAPESGIGGASSPFSGSVDAFARRLVSFQSSQAANATRDAEAQQIVSSSLQDRFDGETGVSIDDEMSNLLLLQNAYSANARVISTISELFDVLMSIGR